MPTLLELEHDKKLHDGWSHAACPKCPARNLEPLPIARADTASGYKRLTATFRAYQAHIKKPVSASAAPVMPVPPDGERWCERCHGVRWLRADILDRQDPAIGKAIPCPDCQGIIQQRRVDRLRMVIPRRFRDSTFDNFPIRRACQKVLVKRLRGWVSDPTEPWLFMHGPTGVGKTTLSVAVLKAWVMTTGKSGMFISFLDFLELLKNTYGSEKGYETKALETEHDLLDTVRNVDLLVMDDLIFGNGRQDWAAEKLYQVIAGRQAAERRTVLSSNDGLPEVSGKMGHNRTTRRIWEMCMTPEPPDWVIDMSEFPMISHLPRG